MRSAAEAAEFFTRLRSILVWLGVSDGNMGTSTDGIWCDPFYGCWPIGQHHNVNQFETAGGVVFKF